MEGDLRSGIRTNVLWVEEHRVRICNYFFARCVVHGGGWGGKGRGRTSRQCLQTVLCDALEVAYAFRGLIEEGGGGRRSLELLFFVINEREEAMEGRMMSLKALSRPCDGENIESIVVFSLS